MNENTADSNRTIDLSNRMADTKYYEQIYNFTEIHLASAKSSHPLRCVGVWSRFTMTRLITVDRCLTSNLA